MKRILKKDWHKYLRYFIFMICLAFLSACGGVTPGNDPPVVNSFTASSSTITPGENIILTWNVSNATTVSINQGIGTVAAPSGSTTVTPVSTTIYTLTATNSAGSSTATLTVTVGSELSLAIQVVLEEVLPAIPETKTGQPYWCLKLSELLPAGTLIEESYSNSSKASTSIFLAEESYFFYLDLAPNAYYSHPVKYILVNKAGEHQVHDTFWWPKIGGMVPEAILKDIPNQEDIIAGNIPPTIATGTLREYQFLPQLVSLWREGFIVVMGCLEDDKNINDGLLTYNNALNFFTAYQSVFSRTEGLQAAAAQQLFQVIDEMVEEDRQLITIFIIAHGNIDTVNLGGVTFSATQFRNKFLQHPGVGFNLILGSCHSGSFINDLDTLGNIVMIETACGWNESSYTDKDQYDNTGTYVSDVNPTDVGSEWTSSLIEAMYQLADDSTKINLVKELAAHNGVPATSMLIYQAGRGALGDNPLFGLNTNYDLTQIWGWSSPTNYCSVIPINLP